MVNTPRLICIAFTALVLLSLAGAAVGGIVVWIDQSNGNLYFRERPGVDSPQQAVEALVAGPTQEEAAMGLGTAIPAGTSLLGFEEIAGGAVIELSKEASAGLDEMKIEMIFRQFMFTLHQFGLDADVRVRADGRLLSEYVEPAPAAIYPAPPGRGFVQGEAPSGVGLSGRRITLSPGHGYIYTGTYWAMQRGTSCGYENEDLRDLRLCNYLKTFLENDGAYVQPVREHNMSRGNGPSGHPWWQEGAYVYLRDAGYSCSVYASSSGVCDYTGGVHHGNDDIRARPLASDLDSRGNTDIYVSMHTNAYAGDCTGACPTGTETYYDASSEHATWGAASQALGNAVNPNIVSAINSALPEISPDWGCHGTCVKDSNGAYGEIRIPDRPATLTELGFHDTCDRDAPLMNDEFFRSVAMWGMYKGICEYFGNSPTYAMYSSQYVSDNIPAAMSANEVRSVSIAFRNKGVNWSDARDFHLGAVGDSDPFAGTRQGLGATVVKVNETFTFTFNFVAPATAGNYTTDWRMIRDGFAWLGDTLTKEVQVQAGGSDTEPPTVPGNLKAESTDYNAVSLSWTASTDNVAVELYEIRRNGGVIGTVNHPTVTYNDTSGLSGGTNYTYEVRAKDYAGNYSGWSNSSTTKTWTIVAQDSFANLNQWTPARVADGTYRGVSLDTGAGGESGPPSARADIGQGANPGTNGSYSYLGFPASFAVGYIQCSFNDTSSSNNSRQGISFRKFQNDDPSLPRLAYFLGLDSTIGFGGYDCEVFSASAGWTKHTDTGGARSIAWHKFRIAIDGANVKFYVDGALKDTIAEPVEGPEGCNRFYIGYNYNVNQTGWYDDFLGVFPSPPQATMNAPSGITQDSITWNYTEGIRNWEQGFYIRDLGGALKATGARNSTSVAETGIPANTLCTRTVSAFNGTLESIASNPASATTLSVPPTAGNIQASPPVQTWTNANFTFTSTTPFGPGGVQYYRYEFDQSPTHAWTGFEPQWNNGTLQTSAGATGNWYLHLKGFNSADVANGTLNLGPFYYDGTPPVVNAVTDDGAWTASTSELHFTLSSSDTGSGVASHEYAVGATSGGTQIRDWTAIGATTDFTAAGLSLSEGQDYFIGARATDNVGLTGGAAASSGIRVAPLAASIGDAKLLAQNAPCRLLARPVVAVFGGRIYIEEANRSAALAVVPDAGTAALGDLIDVAGLLSDSTVERSIAGDYLKTVGSGSALAPVLMLTSRVGGSAFGPTPGASGGVGLNNVGLLAAVVGTVSDADPGTGTFRVNDGSGPLVIKAPGLTIPTNGEFKRVVGIVRLDDALAPYLAPRSQADISAL